MRHICSYHEADEDTVAMAIECALAAKAGWETMPWGDRAAIFLKAADLVSKKYRYKLMAATILGQGKNVWQAEIDAVAEVSVFFHHSPTAGDEARLSVILVAFQLADFFRFGAKYVEELYSQQPPRNSAGAWKCAFVPCFLARLLRQLPP